MFLSKFNLTYVNHLKKLLYIPNFFFDDKSYNASLSTYIKENYEEEEIKKIIINCIKHDNIVGDFAIKCILFCKENNCDVAINLADTIIKDKEYSEYSKQCSIEYLFEICDEQKIVEKYISCNDINVIHCLVRKCKNYHKLLENRLIDINLKSQDETCEIADLIKMNSKYGLLKYLQLSVDKNQPPDYSNDSNYMGISEAISHVKSVELLDGLIELLLLKFSKGFKDKDFGLGHSLNKAFENIACVNYNLVKEKLNQVISTNKNNKELIACCNYLVFDNNYDYYQSQDKPYSELELQVLLNK